MRKTHSTAGSTFQSPNGGPLGYVVEGQPRLVNALPHQPVVPNPVDGRPKRVALITVCLGDDGVLLDGLADRVDGVVVAGFGVGHVPQHLVGKLQELAEQVPVVLASRTGAGPVLADTYGFTGSERDLLARGLIRAGFLDPLKSRILLSAVLATGADRKAVTAAWPWTLATTVRDGAAGA